MAGGLTTFLDESASRRLSRQGRIHLLLACTSPLQIEQLYRVVFERILGENVSTSPVELAQTPIP
jgi:hypothetical protein